MQLRFICQSFLRKASRLSFPAQICCEYKAILAVETYPAQRDGWHTVPPELEETNPLRDFGLSCANVVRRSPVEGFQSSPEPTAQLRALRSYPFQARVLGKEVMAKSSEIKVRRDDDEADYALFGKIVML